MVEFGILPGVAAGIAPAWHLYMLECIGGSIYTGIAKDVEARFSAHCQGKGAKYTRSRRPIRILKTIGYSDRSAASKAEYQVKHLTAAKKRAFCELK
jgi:putative endonuclease